MNKRPLSITLISWIFIVFGITAFITSLLPVFGIDTFHSTAEFKSYSPFIYTLILMLRLMAAICGIFMLYAANWARWLLALWLIVHVIISIWNSSFELVIHILLLILVSYYLFRPQSTAYFKSKKSNII